MSRNPFEGMDREPERKPARRQQSGRPDGKSNHTGLIVAIVGGALVVVIGLPVVCLVICAGLASISQPRAKPGEKTWTREEFKKLVVGKPSAEVLSLLGPPAQTSEIGRRATWTYQKRTIDPATGKADYSIRIYFVQDVVDDVAFTGG